MVGDDRCRATKLGYHVADGHSREHFLQPFWANCMYLARVDREITVHLAATNSLEKNRLPFFSRMH